MGIINCINELKSATFLPPLFSRVPLHRQFLQKSTKLYSSIFITNTTIKIGQTALLSVKSIGLMKLRRTKVTVEILSEELCGLVQDDWPSEKKPYHDGIDDVVVVVLQGAYSLRPRHVGL